jgi:aminodeoxyfutalosine synthase
LSQTALAFGVNDLEGTVVREKIYHAVGAQTPQGMTLAEILKLIRWAKRIPAERDSFYHIITRFDEQPAEAA